MSSHPLAQSNSQSMTDIDYVIAYICNDAANETSPMLDTPNYEPMLNDKKFPGYDKVSHRDRCDIVHCQ